MFNLITSCCKLLLLILLMTRSCNSTGIRKIPKLLNITILYESLCQNSVQFFTEQFLPAWPSLAPYTNFKYVPFGKAYSLNNGKRFHCPHGRTECTANKMQSCALHILHGQPHRQFLFLTCQMNGISDITGNWCFKEPNLNEWKVRQCENSELGTTLQLMAENVTLLYSPEFVPAVIFNDMYYRNFQTIALTDFKTAACRFLPENNKACN